MANKLFFILLAAALGQVHEVYWDYFRQGQDWSGYCSIYHLQSPIDLSESDSIEIPKHSDISLILKPEASERETQGYFDTHTFRLDGPWGTIPSYEYGSSSNIHNLTIGDVLFHAPSEHTINGEHADLEVQLYMKNSTSPIELVLSLLFNQSKGDKKFFEDVINSVEKSTDINLQDAFDGESELTHLWYYFGGHTAYPCETGIRWYVWGNVGEIGEDQLSFFTKRWEGDRAFAGGKGNNRKIQSTNSNERYISHYNWD